MPSCQKLLEKHKTLTISQSSKMAILYLVLSLIAGCILVQWDARPATNDAEQHWNRAYLISQGQFVAQENPQNKGHFGGYINNEFVEFNNTAVNSPVCYFPSWFSNGRYKLACFLTLLISALITASAILLSGAFAPIIMAISLLPMVFLSYLYPTADAMTNSISLLFVSSILHYYSMKRKPSWIEIAPLILLGSVVGLVKITCIILLLFLLLPLNSLRKSTGKLAW